MGQRQRRAAARDVDDAFIVFRSFVYNLQCGHYDCEFHLNANANGNTIEMRESDEWRQSVLYQLSAAGGRLRVAGWAGGCQSSGTITVP